MLCSTKVVQTAATRPGRTFQSLYAGKGRTGGPPLSVIARRMGTFAVVVTESRRNVHFRAVGVRGNLRTGQTPARKLFNLLVLASMFPDVCCSRYDPKTAQDWLAPLLGRNLAENPYRADTIVHAYRRIAAEN